MIRVLMILLLLSSCVTQIENPPTGQVTQKSTIANQKIGEGGSLSIIDAGSLGEEFTNKNEIYYECYYDTEVDGFVDLWDECSDLDGANFNEELGILYWTPDYELGDVSYEFLIYASNGIKEVEEIFTITVSDTNRAPELIHPPAETSNENGTIFIDIDDYNTEDDYDIDGDSIFYSCYYPSSSGSWYSCSVLGVDFDSFDGTFEWTPSFNQAGEYEFVIFASDGEMSDTTTIRFTIEHVNRVPTITQVDDQTIYETEAMVEVDVGSSISGSDYDLDADKLLYSCYYDKVIDDDVENIYPCSDLNVDFNSSVGKLNWTPDVSLVVVDEGSTEYEFKITATDGQYSDETIFVINVLNFEYNAYVDVDTGSGHTCVIKDDGMVYCFGRNDRGQLGDGSRVDQVNLQKVDFDYFKAQDQYLSFQKVYTSSLYSCALSHKGEAFCWGAGDEGQLGNGTTDDSPVPVKVDMSAFNDDTAFKKLALGYEHACGITGKGSMYCWGSNDFGKLGVEDGDSVVKSVSSETFGPALFHSFLGTNGGVSTSTDSAETFTNVSMSDIANNYVQDLVSDASDSDIKYVATKNGLTRIDYSSGTTYTPYTTDDDLASNDVKAVYADGDDLYLATSEGLSISSDYGASFTTKTVADGLGSNDCRHIWVDGSDIYVATANGISISDDNGVSFTNYTTLNGLGSNDVRTIAVDDDGVIYVGTSKGLSISTNGGVSYRHYEIDDNSEANYINAIQIIDIVIYRYIFLGTRNGVYYSLYSNELNFINYSFFFSSLGEPIIYDLLYDNENNFFLGSLNGLYLLDSADFLNINSDDGISFSNGDTEHMPAIDRSTTPVKLNSTTPFNGYYFSDVTLGKHHTCGLTEGGNVYCWGDNSALQIGEDDSVITKADEPNLVDMSYHSDVYIKSISAGDYYTCALSGGGEVYCWGENSKDQFGDGTSPSNHLPTKFDISSFTSDYQITEIDAGSETMCARTAMGTGYCWGEGDDGQIGDGNATDATTPEIVDMSDHIHTYFKKIKTGKNHSCGITGAGQVHCWGDNSYGQLGDGTYDQADLPSRIDDDYYMASYDHKMHQVVTGKYFSCGLSGRGIAYCWGKNSSGVFGNGTTTSSETLKRVDLKEETNPYFKMLAAGDNHVCGLTDSGDVYCWGSNTQGQLGDASTLNSYYPQLVDVSGLTDVVFESISANAANTCGLTGDGSVYCWGDNAYGQVGDGTMIDKLVPTLVYVSAILDKKFSEITMGKYHSCGITANNTSYCWGDNSDGQLGVPSDTIAQSSTPQLVDWSEYSSGVINHISAGDKHTCGKNFKGITYCWGLNTYGQLGNRNSTTQETPDAVFPFSGTSGEIISLALGANASCGINALGEGWCWGLGYLGQLGSVSSDEDIPRKIEMDPYSDRFSAIDVGYDHTCANTYSGNIYCWGQNNNDQLGPITGDQYLPKKIELSY